ncbi:MAG: trypsin-like peptidase domain-containing protein [Acidobacteriota bacterium]|nr:trypsin-like peptidase domain-containing protein [Acidobacteriota bacterium]
MRRVLVYSSILSAGVLAGVVLSGTLSRTDTSQARTQPQAAAPAPQRAAPGASDLTIAAERALQSVANISSTTLVQQPLYQDFFGRTYRSTPRQASSLGSGVVVSADGYVLTNAHVLRGGSEALPISVKVVLSDKKERDARVVGIDDTTDIGVVKIEGAGFTPIAWGNSDQLRIAESVLAIGNPFSLSQTVTMGIVSAVGRANLGLATYENFIQTDAAINRGNSGGALVNTRGELVGINTAIFSETGGYQGIGFAVPSSVARRVLEDLKQYGTVRRGSVGYVDFQSLTDEITREYNLAARRGVFVWEMSEDASAYRAGLRPGDVITSFNGQPVTDPAQITRLIADTQAGASVRLSILRLARGGAVQELSLDVPVTAVQPQPQQRRRR